MPSRKPTPKPKPKPKPNSKARSHPKPKANSKMPGLTVDTSPTHMTSQNSTSLSQSNPSQSHDSRPASPVRPPYSPLTPTLEHARLATSTTSTSQNALPPRQTYIHSQPPQTAIPQPPLVPITLDQNPDAIALRSAISILQLQARNATADIQTLQRIKERAVVDPEAFARALAAGEVSTKSDPLFAPSQEGDEEEGEDKMEGLEENSKRKEEKWGTLPRPQNVVRCPPINWTQYAVVGDSLDKLHKDQQARPTEGMPQILQSDRSLAFGGEGQRRREDIGVAAPYQPGKDKIDKMGTRKGGKR